MSSKKYSEGEVLEMLRGLESSEGESGVEETLEKVASLNEVLEEAGASLEDLNDDDTLEALAAAGVDEDELVELLEYLEAEAGDEDMGKEASGEDLYEAGYLYGAGLAKGMNDGMEKTAGIKSWLAGKFPAGAEAHAGSGKAKRVLRRMLLKDKGAGALSKLKAAGVGAGALGVGVGGALGLRALLRRKKGKKGKK